MKKITFFVAFSILLRFVALSQQTPTISVISYLPEEASGYLIFDYKKYPTVKDWIVEIQQKSTNAAGVVTYNTVGNVNVLNSYFSKIAPQYANGNYYLKVSGKNASGIIVVSQGPLAICPGCPGDGQSCSVYCIAPTYAWRGDYQQGGGNTSLFITATNNPDGSPAYVYFANLPTGPGAGYYGCSAYNLDQGDKIEQLYISPSNPVLSVSGQTLAGNVYGIKKYLGYWSDYYDNHGHIIQAQNISSDFQSLCDAGTNGAVGIINTNSFSSALTPTLSCSGSSAGGIGGGGNGLPESSAGNFLVECYYELIDDLDNGIDPIVAFENQIDCQNNQTPAGFNWPYNVAVIKLKPYMNPNGTAILLKESDFYSPNGDFTPPPITLQKGLYMMGIQFTDNSYATVFFESKQVKTYTYPKSNLLSAVVAPVPVVGNSFNLNLTAYSNLNFTYKLKNSSGTQIYSKQYSLSKNQTMQDQITIPNGIPAGQLFNSFVFSDGSELKFQTYK